MPPSVWVRSELNKGGINLIFALLFGLGAGLFFMGLLPVNRKNRFWQELKSERTSRWLALLRPLTYWGPIRCFLGEKKPLSLVEMEDLLNRAGRPWELRDRDILLARIVGPIIVLVGLALFYGTQATFFSLRQLAAGDGVVITRTAAWAIPAIVALPATIAAFYAPVVILHYLARQREKRVMAELGLFSEVVFMSLKARLNLREAIEEAAKTTAYLKPYLQVCLNQWHTDRIKALYGLKRELGVPGFQLMVDLLIQAATIGDEGIAEFLEENKKLEDEIKNIEVSARSKLRPLLITLQMVLPFGVVLIVLFYPLITQVERIIRNF